jgi:predicted transposase YdaD
VIRLWEQPTEIFQQYQGLLPFAALSQTNAPEEILRQVAKQIENIADKQLQSNVAASTAIISGIALSKEIIQRLLRSDIMKESVIYQDILQQGRKLGEESLILRLLNRRFGNVDQLLIQKVQVLSVEQLENLGEALFDFSEVADLVTWLNQKTGN